MADEVPYLYVLDKDQILEELELPELAEKAYPIAVETENLVD